MKIFLLLLLINGAGVYADSFIRVINKSSVPVQAIWQAAACPQIVEDWEGDNQYTVCKEAVVPPGKEDKFNFDFYMSDRSMKLFTKRDGAIGYCNSMDYSSITVSSLPDGNLKVETNC